MVGGKSYEPGAKVLVLRVSIARSANVNKASIVAFRSAKGRAFAERKTAMWELLGPGFLALGTDVL
jgi:hypothetical protein